MLHASVVELVRTIDSRAAFRSAAKGAAKPLAETQDLLEILVAGSAVGEVPLQPGLHRLDRSPGQRPERAGVQVGDPLKDRELRPNRLEVYATTASIGA